MNNSLEELLPKSELEEIRYQIHWALITKKKSDSNTPINFIDNYPYQLFLNRDIEMESYLLRLTINEILMAF